MCTHTIDMHELKGAVRWVLTSETTFKLHMVNYRYPYMYSIHIAIWLDMRKLAMSRRISDRIVRSWRKIFSD